MSPKNSGTDEPYAVRIPSDVDQPDRLVAGLTARQVVILAVSGLLLWILYRTTAVWVSPIVALLVVAPLGGLAVLITVGRRDGVALDRWLLAACQHRRAPRRYLPATDQTAHRGTSAAALRLPVEAIESDGLIDVGEHGEAVLVDCAPVNFALRTPGEQEALVGAMARWLHGIGCGVQILVRSQHTDLGELADRIADGAPELAHPALEDAAAEHAEFLDRLDTERDITHRQVTVVVRDPRGQAMRIAGDTVAMLAAAEVTARILDGVAASDRVAQCVDPYRIQVPGLAPTDAVITRSQYPGHDFAASVDGDVPWDA